MDVVRDGDDVPARLRGGVLALGNFDGVHLGHLDVIGVARDEARARGGPAGVVFFAPHPRRYFQPETHYFRLTPEPLKLRLLAAAGLDVAFILTFDSALATTTAEAFMQDILKARLGAACVVAGWNFRFGHGRHGSASTLISEGPGLGFDARILQPALDVRGEPISATRIRAFLGAGRPRDAAGLLGYWWRVVGPVVDGEKRGRKLGFPTANMVLEAGADPARGIYAVRAEVDGRRHHGVAYLGTRPVFGGTTEILETHLFDFDGDLYGKEMAVEFIDYLRADGDFEGVEALKAAIAEDCAAARKILGELEGADPYRSAPSSIEPASTGG